MEPAERALCLECGKAVLNGLDLCSKCEHDLISKELLFKDFFKTVVLVRTQESKPRYPVVRLTPEEIGFRVPTWQEEVIRLCHKCHFSSGPQNLADYIHLVHQACIDKRITCWNMLLVVVNFFKKEWCIRKYYDPGQVEDTKKKIPARSRGWKLAIWNPFDFMEWSNYSFANWVNVTMKDLGWTRKQLVAEAERITKNE